MQQGQQYLELEEKAAVVWTEVAIIMAWKAAGRNEVSL